MLQAGSNNGFVRSNGRRFFIDRRQKLGTILTNEIVLHELIDFLASRFEKHGVARLLDAGAGTEPYAPVYEEYFSSCISFDTWHSPHNMAGVDLLASGACLPFQNEVFDCIICTEVLEHIPEPVAVLKEFNRVLRPGGYVFLTTPFLVPLHEMPHDYFRYTPSALRNMPAAAGLEVEKIDPKGDWFAVSLLNMQFPITKAWFALSRRMRMPLFHPYNPAIYLTVVLPQLLYLWYWKRVRHAHKETLFTRLYRKLSYITLGYVTVLKKS